MNYFYPIENKCHMNSRSSLFQIVFLFIALTPFIAVSQGNTTGAPALKPVAFTVQPQHAHTFRIMNPGYPFRGKKNSIVRLAPALGALTGARNIDGSTSVQLKFNEN